MNNRGGATLLSRNGADFGGCCNPLSKRKVVGAKSETNLVADHTELSKQVWTDKKYNPYSIDIGYTKRRERGKAAFTLAEVLITLGIIGVVAAMTIPTLISDYRKKQASIKLKKFYSMMTQAIQMSEVENGSALYWTYTGVQYDNEGNVDDIKQRDEADKFYAKYLAKYLKTVKIENDPTTERYKRIILADGSVFSINNGDCVDIRYDLNGDGGPNETGKDKFVFLLCGNNLNSVYHPTSPNKAFGGYASIWEFDTSTREKALAACEEKPIFCSGLLEIYDNWEFKDDYPY